MHLRNRRDGKCSFWGSHLMWIGCAIAGSLCAPQAKAAFINDYALSKFTLTNTQANGTVVSPDGGLSIILTGGNNGSGLSGTTDLVIMALKGGTVRFDYAFTSLDYALFDFGGYLSAGVFSPLADTDGQSGTATFTINAGDTFGFRLATEDNTGEPGVLTISNFSAPVSEAAAVPEPGSLPVLLAITAVIVGIRLWKVQSRSGNGRSL